VEGSGAGIDKSGKLFKHRPGMAGYDRRRGQQQLISPEGRCRLCRPSRRLYVPGSK
jgi:hypothetical protein